MADGVTMEQILEEQKAIALLAGELAKTSDPERIEQIAAMIAQMTAALQAMCEQLVKDFKEAHPEAFDLNGLPIEKPVPRIEVLLTPAQREQIQAETGVDMPSVLIDDPTGNLMRTMREATPEQIEVIAMEKARAFVALVQAMEQAAAERAALEAALTDEERALLEKG